MTDDAGAPRPRGEKTAKKASIAEASSNPTRGRGTKVRRRRRHTQPTEPPAQPPRTSLWVFLVFVALGSIFAAVAGYLLVFYPQRRAQGGGHAVELMFARDEPVDVVASRLAAAGIVASPRTFALYARLVGLEVREGSHLLVDDATPDDVVHRLERRGVGSKVKLVVPEGFTRFDIAERLETSRIASARAFLEATVAPDLLRELNVSGDSAEGHLFPATYEFSRDADPADVVRRMVGEFDRRFATLERNHALALGALAQTFGWGKHEVLTLASLIEREAAVDDERPLIASVFLNRLRDPTFKRHVLQCDPTAGYGCRVLGDRIPSCVGYAGKITHAINFDPLNPYSTYVHEGLPPGPIANPGMKSLVAALAPADTKYLYFVLREGRHHTFSETLEDHNAAVKELRERTSNARER